MNDLLELVREHRIIVCCGPGARLPVTRPSGFAGTDHGTTGRMGRAGTEVR
jgi:hypothetical protein